MNTQTRGYQKAQTSKATVGEAAALSYSAAQPAIVGARLAIILSAVAILLSAAALAVAVWR